MSSDALALAPLWYLAFLLSLCCHEGAHAWAAKLGGDPTAYLAGSMTLNPIPHIRREPFGTVILPILSYWIGGWMIGWASAPYDPAWQRREPRRAALMALAGPAANVSLALGAAAIMHVGLGSGTFAPVPPFDLAFARLVMAAPGAGPVTVSAAALVSIVFSLNVLLASFNLMPLPPLDGINVLGLVLPARVTSRLLDLTRDRTVRFVGLIIAWKIFGYVFRPVFGVALTLI